MSVSTPRRKASTSNWPLGPPNFIRFSEERLQAESSRNMYSEHGFDALIRDVFLQGCQRLMVVSNCMPGSPHCQVASPIFFRRSLALKLATTEPSRIDLVEKSVSR